MPLQGKRAASAVDDSTPKASAEPQQLFGTATASAMTQAPSTTDMLEEDGETQVGKKPATATRLQAAGSGVGPDLNDKLNKLGFSETPRQTAPRAAPKTTSTAPATQIPSGLPAYLSQLVASASQSQTDEPKPTSEGGSAPEEGRPRKIRKVSVVSRPLKV